MLSTIALAIVLFASTNLDDVFVLLAFFADSRLRAGQIVVGQYIGMSALMIVSVALSLVSLVMSPEHVGLLGLFPVLIGLKKLVDLRRHDDAQEDEPKGAGLGAALSVAAVTIANGGDNVATYTPVFAPRSAFDITVIGIVFAVMKAIWVFLAHRLVNHPRLGAPILRYGHRVVPFVLIGLGVLILHDAGSLHLLEGLAAGYGP